MFRIQKTSQDNLFDNWRVKENYTIFFSEYWHEVFTTLLSEIQEGWTPNPDVECNKHIKFGHFYKYCMENIGCNAVATGHYARSSFGDFLEYYDNNR